MKKIITIFIMTMLILFSMYSISLAEELESEEVKVKIKIPVMQKLNIIEAPVVSFDYPWKGAKDGQPLIIEEVAQVEIISNADWALNVNDLDQSKFNLYIRKSKENFAKWKALNNSGTIFRGENGKEVLSWDIKIEPLKETADSLLDKTTKQLQLNFTLTKL
ncbi:MAG: hypothetical protein ACQEQD_08730 [Bacillota bacterium]